MSRDPARTEASAVGRCWHVWGTRLVCAAFAGCLGCGPSEPQAPGGGQEVSLDYPVFVASIEPILQSRGCSNMACHGGQGSGELLLSGGAFPEADFLAVRGLVTPWDPPQSPLLQKPLAVAAGGVVHGGGDIFVDTSDTDYVTMLEWITPEAVP